MYQLFEIKELFIVGLQLVSCIAYCVDNWHHTSVYKCISLPPLSKPSAFKLPAAAVTATVASVDEENGTASITLISESEGVALYAWLSTLAHGRFEDNGFMLLPGTATLDFIAFGSLDSQSLQASLRVEHLGEHLSSPY